jgi:hypothetical protein
VASKSKAPDITERTIIDLSGRTSQYYDLNGNAFDVAIGGLPFIMAVTDSTPYKRQTADFRAQRVDQMRDPGEHTLAGSGYWTRSQSSWHYGEGIQFTEPMEGNDMEVRFRYNDSYGIDPWTPGQISLLKTTTLVKAMRGKSSLASGSNSGSPALLLVDEEAYSASVSTAIYKITTSNTVTAFATYASLGNAQIIGQTSDGQTLFISTNANIYDINITTGAVHTAYNWSKTPSDVKLKYVKGRVIAAALYTDGTSAAFELLFPNKGSGAAINTSTLTAISGSTTVPANWAWTTITEARAAIYIGGYSGEHSALFKLTVDSAGALQTIVNSATMPRGEVLLSSYGYLGTYIMLGTNKGARVAQSDSNGDLTYGPIVFHNENGVYDFEARDSYVWCGNTNGVNTSSGTKRINLAQPITLSGYAQPISTGVYARANDVFADAITGTVRSVRIFGTSNLVAFTIDGSGVWIQSATDLVVQGEIKTGYIRYDTLENKAWKRIRVRTPGDTTVGEIEVFKRGISTDTVITSITEGEDTSIDYDLSVTYPDIVPDAAFKLEMYRNATDPTTGAVVIGIGVKALPTPTRARILQIPLFCYDKETDKTGNIIGYEGYAKDRLVALETAEAKGDTLVIQDFNAGGDPFEVVVEQVTFTRSTPANRNYSGFGGVIQVVARTVV